ncbi:MAG: tetratricopeptide repeat protein [Candidatus Delongbacteria bacterium]|nr:tetratricopeptide repeat protein [Candidatus Delongbacteria bacterium]
MGTESRFRGPLYVLLMWLVPCLAAVPWTPDADSRLDRIAVSAILAEFSGDQQRALSQFADLLRADPSLVFAADALRELALMGGSAEALSVLGPWTLQYRNDDTAILSLWLESQLDRRSLRGLDDALASLPDSSFTDIRIRGELKHGDTAKAWKRLDALSDWNQLNDEDWIQLLEWRNRESAPFTGRARELALDWLSVMERGGRSAFFDRGLASLPAHEGAELRLRQDLAHGRLDSAWAHLERMLGSRDVPPDAWTDLLQWVRLSNPGASADSTLIHDSGLRALTLLDHSPMRDDAPALLAKARLHWLLDQPDPALASLASCLERDSLQVDALVLQGHIHLTLAAWQPALDSFQSASRLFPGHPDILDPLAFCLQQLGRLREAAPLRAALVEAFPAQQSFWIDYGNLLQEMGERDAALALSMEAVRLFGDRSRPMLLNNTAYLMAQMDHDLPRAELMVRQALSSDPDSPFYLDTLGWIQLKLGEPEQARVSLERARELSPADPEILEHLGELYLALGQHALVRQVWREALGLQPDNGRLRLRLDALDEP